jgi:hypothetical protein
MAPKELDDKLTPVAREMLDELLEQQRERLLIRAAESAKTVTGELREISVHDVLRSLQDDQRLDAYREQTRRSFLDRILRLYAATGVLIGGVGVTMYFFRQTLSKGNFAEQLPLLIGLTGFMLAAAAWMTVSLRASRGSAPRSALSSTAEVVDANARFISLWIEVEDALRRAVSERVRRDAPVPISSQIEMLTEQRRLTSEEATTLRALVALRNRILHSGDRSSAAELRSAVERGERLLRRLRELAPRSSGS